MKKMKPLVLFAFILGSLFVGSLGSVFTAPSIPYWYSGLIKPAFNPPNWIFAPVWTLLFILMGISAYLVWQKGWIKKQVKISLSLFLIQFVFNVLWSYLFFGLQSPLLGFNGIVLLWLLIVATIISFWKVNKTAAFLLLPYFLWVSFASYLNYSILILNK